MNPNPAFHPLSVIVPAYNCDATLGECLDAILRSACRGFECLVVDDSSSDGSRATAESRGVKVVRLAERHGPAYARNRGAESALNPILFFIDSDVRVHPDTLATAVEMLESDPSLAAVIGSYDDQPPAKNFFSQFKNLFHHYVHQHSSEQAGTFWAGCGAMRKSVFEKAGGFDESYTRPCVEDIELGYRLTEMGCRIRMAKSVQVTHLKEWSFASMLRSDIMDRALPWTRLILERNRLADDLNLTWSARCSTAAVFAALAAAGAAPMCTPLAWAAGAMLALAVALNAPLYAFFAARRGTWFALRCVPVHLLYLAYAGAAFAVGWLGYQLRRTLRMERKLR